MQFMFAVRLYNSVAINTKTVEKCSQLKHVECDKEKSIGLFHWHFVVNVTLSLLL